jgi:hypothetical protein
LRKYAWLVALFVLGIGVLLPLVQSQRAPVYEAEALVASVTLSPVTNLDAVPRYGDRVFDNGEVAAEIREVLSTDLGVEVGRSADVIPRYVESVSEQDNPSFTIIGRSDDPNEAVLLADVAAATFVSELNSTTSESIGTFAIQSSADPPSSPVPSLGGGGFALVLGALAGLLAGIGAVALLMLFRRPVLDSGTAAQVAGVPVVGRVLLSRHEGDDLHASTGLAPLCRRLLAGSSSVVILVSSPKDEQYRHRIAAALSQVLRGQSITVVEGPTTEQLASRPRGATVLLVTHEGVSQSTLRDDSAEYLALEDDGGLVLVGKQSRWGRRRKSSSATAPREAPPSTGTSSRAAERSSHRVDDSTPTGDAAATGDASRSGSHPLGS